MTALLAVQGASKSYPKAGLSGERRRVLSNIDFDIAKGNSVALLGRSGSGKSTLGRLILGFERPDAGQILFDGRNLAALSRADQKDFRRQVQVVFQDSVSAVNPRHRIGRIIAEPLRHLTDLSRHQIAERVDELLLAVGLQPEDAVKLPLQMSGGQLQRVCIARALAPRPSLIVLDEAVSNLDLVVQMRVIALLKQLQQEQAISFLFVTHDLRLVNKFCQRVLVLDQGNIVEDQAVIRDLELKSSAGRTLQAAILPSLPAVQAEV